DAKGETPGGDRGFFGASANRRSILREDRSRSRAEQNVQADLDHVLRLFDVERNRTWASGEAGHRSAHDGVGAGAEVVVVVLDEAGEPVGEGVFKADADRPPAAGVAERGSETREGEGEVVPLPRAAALHVAKEAVPCITDTAGHRGDRLDME